MSGLWRLQMARTEIVTITNMCMIYDGSKVLVQEKIDDDYCGITFPGGHVEKGESLTDAVIREVFEETGLKISSPVLCGIKDWSNDEGKVYWLELEEMKKANLADGMDKMLEVFLNENISEYFFYKENDKWVEVLK